MKYAGMPMGMWVLFAGSFQKQLTAVLGYDAATARAITKKAKPQYRHVGSGSCTLRRATLLMKMCNRFIFQVQFLTSSRLGLR